MTRLSVLLVSAVMLNVAWSAQLAAQQAQERTAPDWQNKQDMFGGVGLVLKVRAEKDIPRLYTHAGPYCSGIVPLYARAAWYLGGEPRDIPVRPVRLGGISAGPGRKLVLKATEGDWSYRTYVYAVQSAKGRRGADELALEEDAEDPMMMVTVSRLWPGVLVESNLARVTVMGDARAAERILTGGNRERIKKARYGGGFGQELSYTGTQAPVPSYAAYSSGGKVAVHSIADKMWRQEIGELDQSWFLFWFGKRKHGRFGSRGYTWGVPMDTGWGDIPVLVVCQNTPVRLHANAGQGLGMDFENRAGKIVMLPLYGLNHPLDADTQKWSEGLPDHVVDRCRALAGRCAVIPIKVRERYAYDQKNDVAILSEDIETITVTKNGKTFAPLPPMAALALRYGFPIEVRANGRAVKVTDLDLVTPYGPYMVVEGSKAYELRIKGMAKYVRERRGVGPEPRQPSAGYAKIARRLATEIRDVLKAGHLAPVGINPKHASLWWGRWRSWGAVTVQRLWYSNPGDTICTLNSVVPVIDRNQQKALAKYIQDERLAYPPETVAHLKGTEGARREPWNLNKRTLSVLDDPEYRGNNFHLKNKIVPAENAYALAAYYLGVGRGSFEEDKDDGLLDRVRAVLDPYDRRGEWASLGWRAWESTWDLKKAGSSHMLPFLYGFSRTADTNRMIAGLMGAVRLHRLGEEKEQANRYMALLCRALVQRYAIGRYAEYLYETGVLTMPEGASPLQDIRQLMITEEGVILREMDGRHCHHRNAMYTGPYLDVVPELARFVRDSLKPQAKTYIDEIAMWYPDWFMKFGVTTACMRHGHLAEVYTNWPIDAQQVFNVRAIVLNQSGDELAKYVDCPWVRIGDWYFVERLAETLRAYRGTEWEQIKGM